MESPFQTTLNNQLYDCSKNTSNLCNFAFPKFITNKIHVESKLKTAIKQFTKEELEMIEKNVE